MTTKTLFAILLTLLMMGCSHRFNTCKVGEQALKKASGEYLYYTPQTQFEVSLHASVKYNLAGPYAEYAYELLGIKSTIIQNQTHWQIDSVSLKTHIAPDPSAIYAISSCAGLNENQRNQMKQLGLYVTPSLNLAYLNSSAHCNTLPCSTPKELSFTGFKKEMADTFYKTILRDSIFVKIPIIKNRVEAKTIAEKAKEAADFIMKLRQTRNEFIMQEDGAINDSKILQIALDEMKRLENEYIVLFTGRTITVPQSLTFGATPVGTDANSTINLVNFSAANGFVTQSDSTAKPVTLHFVANKANDLLRNYIGKNTKIGANQVYYRIPERVKVAVKLETVEFLSGEVDVLQFGELGIRYIYTEK